MTKKANFRETVRAALAARSVTQKEVCGSVGLAQSNLSRWLTGEQAINSDALERLADYLGLDLRPKIDPKNNLRKS